MAQVLLAKGEQWLQPLPKTLTPAMQHTLGTYINKAKVYGNKVELWGYRASGALAIKTEATKTQKPLDKATRKGYKGCTLGFSTDVRYNLNAKGNPVAYQGKLTARVCHNVKGVSVKK